MRRPTPPPPDPWGNLLRWTEGWSPDADPFAAGSLILGEFQHDYTDFRLVTKTVYDSNDPAQAALLTSIYGIDPENDYRYFFVATFDGAPVKAVFGDYPPQNIIGRHV